VDRYQFFNGFWTHFGNERATKFHMALHHDSLAKKRLYYWQERMLAEFCSKSEMAVPSFDETVITFSRCHLHGVALQEDEVPIQYGTRRPPSPEAVSHANSTYPFARLSVHGPCWVEPATHRRVLFCSACRSACAEEADGKRSQN
jgi:hypothetical protein